MNGENKIYEVFLQLADTGILPILIAVFGFGLLFSIALTFNPSAMAEKSYQRINNVLVQMHDKKIFDYKKIDKDIRKNGLYFHIPFLADPISYLGAKICLSIILMSAGFQLHLGIGVLGFFIGYKLLDFLCVYLNKTDNEKMQSDLQLIYNSLSSQIKSGVYVGDALCESYGLVENMRLKTALLELSGDLNLNVEFKKAINALEDKFDNKYIDSLCVALSQFMDSGQAVDLISDIGDQLKEMQANALLKKKGQMDRSMTIFFLVLFADVIAFILYCCVGSIGTSLTGF